MPGSAHQLAAEALHHGVSLAAGAALGPLTATPSVSIGVVYGLAIWVVDALGLLPALRVQRVGGRGVDAVAHGILGAALAFAMRELASQPRLTPKPAAVPLRAHVG